MPFTLCSFSFYALAAAARSAAIFFGHSWHRSQTDSDPWFSDPLIRKLHCSCLLPALSAMPRADNGNRSVVAAAVAQNVTTVAKGNVESSPESIVHGLSGISLLFEHFAAAVIRSGRLGCSRRIDIGQKTDESLQVVKGGW